MERNDGSEERANKGIEEAKKILTTLKAFNLSEENFPELPIKSNMPWADWNQASDFIVRLWGISEEPLDPHFAKKVFVIKYPDIRRDSFNEALWGLIASGEMELSANRIYSLRPDIKDKFK